MLSPKLSMLSKHLDLLLVTRLSSFLSPVIDLRVTTFACHRVGFNHALLVENVERSARAPASTTNSSSVRSETLVRESN